MKVRDLLAETEHCLWCGETYSEPMSWAAFLGESPLGRFCERCESMLVPIDQACLTCSKPGSLQCEDCVAWNEDPFWSCREFTNRSLYEYNPFLKEVIARFKYRGDAALAEAFSERIARAVHPGSIVTSIPLNDERHYERGFNQATLLAGRLKPVSLLERSLSSGKQSKRSREERIAAAEEQFRILPGAVGKTIVIVDDIYTTGATIRSAARLLYENGAKSVTGVTLARA
ncbi:ComF family protein [Bacillus sp. H-16]|uniref:ComF family protein n=1 Tax=Alteribacter salitolerans TaxID=2912333 RepID=UPI00196265AE|nr:ComF family protein [Alteribacter salitolerans]MBM7096842.1 ComF family protein [Alteribacter salitolerans]